MVEKKYKVQKYKFCNAQEVGRVERTISFLAEDNNRTK